MHLYLIFENYIDHCVALQVRFCAEKNQVPDVELPDEESFSRPKSSSSKVSIWQILCLYCLGCEVCFSCDLWI